MGTNMQLGTGVEDDEWSPVKMSGKQLENRAVLMASSGGQHTVLLVKDKQESWCPSVEENDRGSFDLFQGGALPKLREGVNLYVTSCAEPRECERCGERRGSAPFTRTLLFLWGKFWWMFGSSWQMRDYFFKSSFWCSLWIHYIKNHQYDCKMAYVTFVNVIVCIYIKEMRVQSLLMTSPNNSLFNVFFFFLLFFNAIIPFTLVQTGHVYSVGLICETTVHFTQATQNCCVAIWTFDNMS